MRDAAAIAREYPVTIEPVPFEDGGGYYAYSNKFPGLLGDGDTAEQAIRDFQEVLTGAIQTRINEGTGLPAVTEPDNLYSGKLSLRIARSLHALVVDQARRDDVSINQWISNAIAMAVGGGIAEKRPLHVQVIIANDDMGLRQPAWPQRGSNAGAFNRQIREIWRDQRAFTN